MPNEVLVKYPDGTFKTHLLYRTHEHKEFKEMQNPEKYREQQSTSSIDTLNNALNTLNNEVKSLEDQLELKTEQRSITTDVLRDKLEEKLGELHTNEEPDTFEPRPTVEDMLNDDTELKKIIEAPL